MDCTPSPFALPSIYIYADPTSQNWSLQEIVVKADGDTSPLARQYMICPQSSPTRSDATTVPVDISCHDPSFPTRSPQLNYITHTVSPSPTPPQPRAIDETYRAGHFEPLPYGAGSSDGEDEPDGLTSGSSKPQPDHDAQTSCPGPQLLLNIDSTSPDGLRLDFKLGTKLNQAARNSATSQSRPTSTAQRASFTSLGSLAPTPRSQAGSPQPAPRGPRSPSVHSRGWSLSVAEGPGLRAPSEPTSPVPSPVPSPSFVQRVPLPEDAQEVGLLFITCSQADHLRDFVHDLTAQARHHSEGSTSIQTDGQDSADFATAAAKNVIDRHAGRMTCKAVDLNVRSPEAKDVSTTASKHVLFTAHVKPFSSARHQSPAGQSIICAFVELRHAEKSASIVLAWQFWLSSRPASPLGGTHRPSQHAQASSPPRDESSLVGFPRSESPPFTSEASGRYDRPSRNRTASMVAPAPLLACLDRTELGLEEIESDSPMVRAAFSNLDKRTATLKRACKAMLKCVAEVKSHMAALQASETGLDDCFSNLAAALTPSGFDEVAKRSIAQERTRSAKMRDEQLRCLHEFVELPIKALIDLCRRAQESHTAFEAESKAFYAATQKWLNKSGAVQESPQLGNAQGHQSTNDKGHEKQRHREMRFLLARLELFDAFTRLHGGQAELDMATSALSSYSRLNEVAVNLWTSEGSSARIAALGVTESFIPSLQAERQRVSSIRFACAQRIANVQAHLAASENLLSKFKSQDDSNPKLGIRMSQDLPLSPMPQNENDPIRSPPMEHATSSTMDPKLFPMLPAAPGASPQSKKPRFRNILGSMGTPSGMEPGPSSVSSYANNAGHGVSQASLEEQPSAPLPESPQRQRNFRHFKQLADRLQNSQVTVAALKARNKWRSGSTAPSAVHAPMEFPDISWPDSDGGDGLVEILNTAPGHTSAATSSGGRRPHQSTEASPRLSIGAGQREASPQILRAPSGKRFQSASNDSAVLHGLAVRSPYGPLSGTDHSSSPHRSTSLSGAGINGGSGVGLGLVNRMRPEFTAIRTRSRVTSLGSGRDAMNRSSGMSEHHLQQSSFDGSSQFAPVLSLPSDLQESDMQADPEAPDSEDSHKASESPDQTLVAVHPASATESTSQPPRTSPGRKKEGILWVMSKPISGPGGTDAPRGVNRSYHWREAWVVLSGSGHLSEYSEWRDGSKMLSPSSPVIDLRFATVREARGVDRRFTFEVVTRDHRRFFQAASDEGLRAWIGAISKAIESLINGTSSVRQVEKVAGRKHMPFSPALDGNVPEEHHDGEMDGPDVLVEGEEWSGDGNRRPRDVFDDLSGGAHGSSAAANSGLPVGSHRPWSQSLTDLGTFTSGISGMSPLKLFQRSSGIGSSGTDHGGPSSPTVGDAFSKRSSRQGGKTTGEGQLGVGKENVRYSGQSSETRNRDSNVSSSMYTAQSEASGPSQTEERNASAVSVAGHGTSGNATASGAISNKTPVSGYVGRSNANVSEQTVSHEARPTHLERPPRGGASTSGNGWSLSGAGSEQDFELDQRIEAMVNSHYGSTSDLMNLASAAPASPRAGEAVVSPSLAALPRLSNATDSGMGKPTRGSRFASEVCERETSPSAAHNHQRSASIGTAADSVGGLRKGSNAMSRTKTTTAISDKYTRAAEITAIASRGGNAKCADCRDANPRWASWSLNGVPRCIFICIRCSGMHRSLGVHISKVRSVDLDDWSEEQIRAAREWGNDRVNQIYEKRGIGRGERPKPGHFQGKEFWIKKYVDCIWKVEEGSVVKMTSDSQQRSQRQHEHDTQDGSKSANEIRPATSPTTATSSRAAPIPTTSVQAQT